MIFVHLLWSVHLLFAPPAAEPTPAPAAESAPAATVGQPQPLNTRQGESGPTVAPAATVPANPAPVVLSAPATVIPVTAPVTVDPGIECVVVLGGATYSMAFSPGPEVDGSCAYVSAEYPDAISVTPTPETVTENGVPVG
jgi:hypothetical protein